VRGARVPHSERRGLLRGVSGLRLLGVGFLALMLSACGGPGQRVTPRSAPPTVTPDAQPRDEPLSKYGNPESYVVFGKRYYTLKSARGFVEQGIASWYGDPFHGRRTSSGEIYDMYKMTAAHKQLPLPSYVEVRNLENNRVATLRVNDRGPFHENRVIDLSYAAALKLGVVGKGTAFVEVRAIDPRTRRPATAAPPPEPIPPPPVQQRPQPSPTPGPAVPPAVPAVAGIYIQLGAFQDVANARRLAERVESVAPGAVRIRQVDSQGRILHRVQIGPIGDVEYADAVVAGLARLGITDHHFATP